MAAPSPGPERNERLNSQRAVRTLVDTSVLILALRDDERAIDLLLAVPTEERLVSILTRVRDRGRDAIR